MRYPRDFAPSLSLASDAVKGFPDEMCPTERSRVRATACVFVRLCGHMRVRACGASQFEASPSHPHGRRMVHAVRWVLIGTHCPVRTRLLFLYKAGDIISQVRSCSTHGTHYRTSHRTESHGGPHLPYTRLPHARPRPVCSCAIGHRRFCNHRQCSARFDPLRVAVWRRRWSHVSTAAPDVAARTPKRRCHVPL